MTNDDRERAAAIRECVTIIERQRTALRLVAIEAYFTACSILARVRDVHTELYRRNKRSRSDD